MFEIIELKNGIKVILSPIRGIRSLAIGVWVKTGVVNESLSENGISHFIEHMFFKGTNNRSAKDIVHEIESIGGDINAFTGKEITCFYTRTMDIHANIAIDILADIYQNSVFDNSEIEKEKNVVLQEIKMYQDTPDELIHDVLLNAMWKGSSYGESVLGTKETIEKFDHDMIVDYMNRNYHAKNTIISVAGNFDKTNFIDMLEEKFNNVKQGEYNKADKAQYVRNEVYLKKDTEQNHICLGYEGYTYHDSNMYTLSCINTMLASGMSSLLFQKIREEMSLVYNIFGYPGSFSNGGSYIIYAGLNKENTNTYISAIDELLENFKKNPMNKEELEIAKNKIKASYILGLESSSAMMNYIGKSYTLKNEVLLLDEVMDKINTITLDDIKRVANEVFVKEKQSIAIIGKYNK